MKKLFSNKGMDLTTGPLIPKIITYTIPIILTGVLQLMFNAADLIVVGQFAENGEEALVGINMANSRYLKDISTEMDFYLFIPYNIPNEEALLAFLRYCFC